jgi:hypothetical protein
MTVVLNDENNNLSEAHASNVLFIINDDDLEVLSFWIKKYSLPSISRPTTSIEYDDRTILAVGRKLTFSQDFSTTVFIDEDYKIYDKLYNWIINEGQKEYIGYLLIYNNQRTKIVKRFKLLNIKLEVLGGIEYDNYSTTEVVVDIILKLDWFEPLED